jgi:hypothetical protein
MTSACFVGTSGTGAHNKPPMSSVGSVCVFLPAVGRDTRSNIPDVAVFDRSAAVRQLMYTEITVPVAVPTVGYTGSSVLSVLLVQSWCRVPVGVVSVCGQVSHCAAVCRSVLVPSACRASRAYRGQVAS